jgi:lipoate-protein ligase A
MLCIESSYHDPYFNLASEEYLLKSRGEEFFLLYRNNPSIVVGKHQNTLAEVNLSYVLEHGINVVRRISGGGTVFHDLGNLNFTFLTNGSEGQLVNYQKYTQPIIEAVRTMGIRATLGPRNELLIGKQKISGTASHVYKQRVLHHGTLLFSSDISHLSSALKIQSNRFHDRAVRSVPSTVTNIRDHMDHPMEVSEFQQRIYHFILGKLEGASGYRYTEEDLAEIRSLSQRKFSTWEWNFGYSPRYEYRRKLTGKAGNVYLQMQVEKGTIRAVSFTGDFMSTRPVNLLEELLVGAIHDPETLRMRISGIDVEDYITGLDNELLLAGMF